MQNWQLALTIIISILIIVMIMIQGKGAGLGSAWGGSGETFQTRRGIELWVLRLTAFLIGLFMLLSILNLVL